MSIRLPPANFSEASERDPDSDSVSSSSTGEDDDQNWDDWVSDSIEKQECLSLFDDIKLASVKEAIAYDTENHAFDLDQVCSRLGLDFHGRIRLINYLRRNKISAQQAHSITGKEDWFSSDEYLVPVLENDPLLQISFDDDWSDDDNENANGQDLNKKLRALEKKLILAQQSLLEYRNLVQQKLDLPIMDDAGPSGSSQPPRDDDAHYFDSYAGNDIHAVMIQDKVRTSTYAHFILKNPYLFRDATVLDVGCGTGILSLFAARSGAKRVIAVDASDIAEKAENIVKVNGFEDVITVVRGKVENIVLPDGITQVDIIISEWMGYALLYESMLDSVLVARDRFLKSGGVMAPSQCKMMLALCDATEIYKDRIGFWNDVYGFDMSAMAEGLYEDAIVDVVGPETIASEPYAVKDLILGDISPRQLEFSSDFTLKSTVDRRTKISSFVLYFDTFFNPSGRPISSGTQVKFIKEGDAVLADIWPVGGKPATKRRQSIGRELEEVTSFSTGPQSTPTHWKQTLFMLPEPITVTQDSAVTGSFHLRKRETNSRELDVEIHYSVKLNEETVATDTLVQMYKVR
ncbi:protein arginine N-methyltransferase [Macrolepiota fuliginosa MF-IS2]|uniref:type I protein arginine methyltransferase n=1 Tax=Macrolepiota fuliginosa MF-IS2 TaxID=1400762 RepID=A0A9P6C3W0_9AGAR|nr:protein arginine N-methyltransferase [Macrolepiota fuliginosa MF-IS2]